MKRIVGGVLVLVLLLPALGAQDKPRDKEPAEQYRALLAEFQKANKAYQDAIQAAKSPEEQMKVFREKNPRPTFAPKFVALAEKHPKDPIAVDALVWVVTGNLGSSAKEAHNKAIAILIRDHIQNEKMGRVCESLAFGMDRPGETLLRAVLEKNKNKEAQAEACLALAQRVQQWGELIRRVKDNPDLMKRFEEFYGKEVAADMKKADPDKAEAESEKLFKTLAEKHLTQMKPDRLQSLCQRLSFSGGKGSEAFFRLLLEKDSRRDVQGVAYLYLGQVLKQRAESLDSDEKAAKKVRDESEKMFERAADKFADVKLPFRGTVGEKAKSELFDLRFLAVGKEAPAVEGEDQDRKKFKLSDYRGKVVFLDFWSQF